MNKNKIKLLINNILLGTYIASITPTHALSEKVDNSKHINSKKDKNSVATANKIELENSNISTEDSVEIEKTIDEESTIEDSLDIEMDNSKEEQVEDDLNNENQNEDSLEEDKNLEEDILENDNMLEEDKGLEDNTIDLDTQTGENLGISDNGDVNSLEEKAYVEDNWLNREVARQVYGDSSLYSSLTDNDYKLIYSISMPSAGLTEIPSDMNKLTGMVELYLNGNQISNISNLSNCKSLQVLNLGSNNITNIAPLEGLTSLKVLYIYSNQIVNVEPLKSLIKMETLEMYGNKIITIDSLSGMSNLKTLTINDNMIENVNSLSQLNNLNVVWAQNNYLDCKQGSETEGIFNRIKTLNPSASINYKDGYSSQYMIHSESIKSLDLSIGEKHQVNFKHGSTQDGETFINIPTDINSSDIGAIISNEKIVKVSGAFDITALAGGKATVTFTYKGLKDGGGAIPFNVNVKTEVNDNWLNREVARQVFGDENRFGELNEAEYEKITEIDISDKDISDEIPSEIGLLTNLSSLKLHNNNLKGELPQELFTLNKLNRLWIGSNNITGQIPKEIGNLKNLKYLYLHDNNLTGSIPDEIYTLANLEVLELFKNSLNGTISENIGNLTKLSYLNYSSNMLSGDIPENMYNLNNLTYISLFSNNITGTISSKIGNLTELTALYLSNTKLTGEIPDTIGNLTKLDRLILSSNNLVGELPATITNLTNLSDLRLYNNQLIGEVPQELTSKFSESQFGGNFFEKISNQKEITIKSIRGIETEIGTKLQMPTFKNNEVDVKWNGKVEELNSHYTLEGIIEDKTLYDDSLIAINVGETRLKAKISQGSDTNASCISTNGHNLKTYKKEASLDIFSKVSTSKWTNNDVTVTISAKSSEDIAYIESSNGERFDNCIEANFTISENGKYDFKVETASGITKTTEIVVSNIDKINPTLTLSKEPGQKNTFTINAKGDDQGGSGVKGLVTPEGRYVNGNSAIYSAWKEGLHEFKIVDNAGNINTANIDIQGIVLDESWLAKEVGKQTNKDYKDLTQEDLDKITSINLSNANITGKIPSYIGNLTNLQTLKINGNDLRGEIPSSIGNLNNLKTLWLNDNRFTGEVPNTIGNMENLEVIDLGLNFLSGEIPSSIGNLSKMKRIYLCDNKLTGSIPEELGNLTGLSELCIDFNQLIGRVPESVKKLSARKTLDYNFFEDSKVQNTISIVEDTKVNVIKGEEVNLNDIKGLISLSNDVYSNIPLSQNYSLMFVPDDASYFDENGRPIKEGTVTGRVRIKEASKDNTSGLSENSLTLNILPSSESEKPDTDKPTVEYSLSSTDWTNQSVDISLKTFDESGIKQIQLPDNSIVSEDCVKYTATRNGDYKFRITDNKNNIEELMVKIENIDKVSPILKIQKEYSEATNSVNVSIDAKDDLSGIETLYIDGKVFENTSFNLIRNGVFKFKVVDKAGNSITEELEISEIKSDELEPDTPDDNLSPDVPEDNSKPSIPEDNSEPTKPDDNVKPEDTKPNEDSLDNPNKDDDKSDSNSSNDKSESQDKNNTENSNIKDKEEIAESMDIVDTLDETMYGGKNTLNHGNRTSENLEEKENSIEEKDMKNKTNYSIPIVVTILTLGAAAFAVINRKKKK